MTARTDRPDVSNSSSPLEDFAPALRRYFAKRVPPGDVDDLVQEVMVSFHGRQKTTPIENLQGYLFSVASNVLSKFYRASSRAAADMEVNDELLSGDVITPERIAIGRREVERVIQAIEKLPERTRDIFVAHRFAEMSYSAIAREQGISISAVEKHIMAALKNLAGAIRCP